MSNLATKLRSVKMPSPPTQWKVILATSITGLIFILSSVAAGFYWGGNMQAEIATIKHVQQGLVQWTQNAPPEEFRELMDEREQKNKEFLHIQSEMIRDSIQKLNEDLRENKKELENLRLQSQGVREILNQNMIDLRIQSKSIEQLASQIREHRQESRVRYERGKEKEERN